MTPCDISTNQISERFLNRVISNQDQYFHLVVDVRIKRLVQWMFTSKMRPLDVHESTRDVSFYVRILATAPCSQNTELQTDSGSSWVEKCTQIVSNNLISHVGNTSRKEMIHVSLYNPRYRYLPSAQSLRISRIHARELALQRQRSSSECALLTNQSLHRQRMGCITATGWLVSDALCATVILSVLRRRKFESPLPCFTFHQSNAKSEALTHDTHSPAILRQTVSMSEYQPTVTDLYFMTVGETDKLAHA